MKGCRWPMPALVGGVLGVLIPTVVTCTKVPTAWDGLSAADDTQVSEAVRAVYRDDAARLALRHLNATSGGAPDAVDLPPELVSSLYQALIRVYNIPALAARDSVVTRYAIHTFRVPEVRSLLVGVDSLTGWLPAWQHGDRLTGYPPLDQVMEAYDLDVAAYGRLLGLSFHGITLRSRRPLNIAALATRFTGIAGVVFAEPVPANGGGNDIRASVQAGGWRLDYSVGYGDCLAGCIARHYWTFLIRPDGRVTYEGSWGDPTPPPGLQD